MGGGKQPGTDEEESEEPTADSVRLILLDFVFYYLFFFLPSHFSCKRADEASGGGWKS